MIYFEKDGLVIRTAVEGDIVPISKSIRREDAEEVLAEGCSSIEDALARSFAASTLCLSFERDGVPLAMFGLVPDALAGASARVWMLGAEGIRAVRKSFLRLSISVRDMFLDRYPILWNRVDTRYTGALRWIEFCGGEMLETEMVGPGRIPFTTFIIRRD